MQTQRVEDANQFYKQLKELQGKSRCHFDSVPP